MVAIEGTSLRTSEKDILPDKTGQTRTFRFILEPLPGGSGGKSVRVQCDSVRGGCHQKAFDWTETGVTPATGSERLIVLTAINRCAIL